MANFKKVKQLITETVFPEMVKDGMYSEFAVMENGAFDFSAKALKEIKAGKIERPWWGHEAERIKIVICDREYPDDMLEFDLDYLIEALSDSWFKEDVANTILLVRKVNANLDFSWIRLSELCMSMDRAMITRTYLNGLKSRPQINVTLFAGHSGELFLREEGCSDRLLLNYDKFFNDSVIRSFRMSLDDDRVAKIDFEWQGACKMPGEDLFNSEELDIKLNGTLVSIIDEFRNHSRGQFSWSLASQDNQYFSEDIFDRVVGTVSYLTDAFPGIPQYDLIAKLSRMIAPLPMRNWVQSIAVQYMAMLEEKSRQVFQEQEIKDDVHDDGDEKTLIVRIGCKYSYDCDFNDYEEGERICVDKNAHEANYMILADPDDDESLDGREGELCPDFEYELHDGQLCAIVDGKFVPCEDDYQFECFLRRRDGE